jgi:hypothetical protein
VRDSNYIEVYPQSSGEKLHHNLATTESCLNIENTSYEKLKMIKISNEQLKLRCTSPNAKTQETHEQTTQHNSSNIQQFHSNKL